MLRLQRDLLDEASKAEANISGDNSQYAEHLRAAIRAIREGSSGELTKLDVAANELAQAQGNPSAVDNAQARGTVTPSISQSELRSMVESLDRKVESFQTALRSHDTESVLRQQKELLDEVSRVDQAVKNNRTTQGEQIRSALESIKNGLAGDQSKFEEARRSLENALED